jgi:hypothetical protein
VSSNRKPSDGSDLGEGSIDTGRDLSEFATFRTRRTEHDLPDTLTTLIADVHRHAGRLVDLGHVRVLERTDPALAALTAHDRGLRSLCRPAQRHRT